MQDYEILVVDDGSTDGTGDTVGSLGSDKIRYIRLPGNLGGNVARNAGIRLAQGEFIAFLDDDDAWEAGKLQRQLDAVAGGSGADWCRTGVGIYATNGRYERYVFMEPPFKDRYKAIMSDNYIGVTSSILVRRESLDAIGGFDEALPALQDWDLYIRLTAKGCRLCGVDAMLVRYSKTYVTGSVSGSYRRLRAASALMRQKYRDDRYFNLLSRRLKIIELKRFFKWRVYLMEAVRSCLSRGHP